MYRCGGYIFFSVRSDFISLMNVKTNIFVSGKATLANTGFGLHSFDLILKQEGPETLNRSPKFQQFHVAHSLLNATYPTHCEQSFHK